MYNGRWVFRKECHRCQDNLLFSTGPKLLEINRTPVRRGLGVQCVIILMKYRFETIKQLASVGKIAHFFTVKQSHPFNCGEINSGLWPKRTFQIWVQLHWTAANKSKQKGIPHLLQSLHRRNPPGLSAQSPAQNKNRSLFLCTVMSWIFLS